MTGEQIPERASYIQQALQDVTAVPRPAVVELKPELIWLTEQETGEKIPFKLVREQRTLGHLHLPQPLVDFPGFFVQVGVYFL